MLDGWTPSAYDDRLQDRVASFHSLLQNTSKQLIVFNIIIIMKFFDWTCRCCALLLAIISLLTPSTAAFAPITSSTSSTFTTLHMSGVERNPNFAKLAGGYLFPEIGRRRAKYLENHPDMVDRIISLGIGDTTQPIPPHILGGLVEGASKLGTKEGYSGYGAEQGMQALREKIALTLYKGIISPDEVFVSDGAKCDIMRLQQMFGSGVISAVQDPSYPVYVDTSVMMGQTGSQDPTSLQYSNIIYMPCTPENGFFPDYASLPRADVVYLCSPK
jgi:LL-diaminopimelate aminotransferase